MKNKNKSKKIQKFLANQGGGGRDGMSKNQEQDELYKEKKEKLKREQAAREMALLFKQAPKSKSEIAREKVAASVKRQAKSAKIDLYADPRKAEKDARAAETSDEWDEAKLRQVIGTKAVGKDAKFTSTDIVCKHFLTAVEKGLYGWFWKCQDGASCKYKHNLPPGFVLKKRKAYGEEDSDGEDDGPSLEEIIEESRAKLTGEGTPVTLETFMAWKKKKLEQKAAKVVEEKEEALKAKKLTKQERSLGVGLSGKDLFAFKPEMFQDDEGAADDVSQYLGVGLDEMDQDSAALLKEAAKDESAFEEFDDSAFEDEPYVEGEVVASSERVEQMAVEMIEAAKDMQEEGELDTAVAMFKQAIDDLGGLGLKRPKLLIRIEAIEKDIEEKAANAGEEVFECMYKCGFEGSYAEAEAHEEVCEKKDAAAGDDALFEDSDDSDEVSTDTQLAVLLLAAFRESQRVSACHPERKAREPTTTRCPGTSLTDRVCSQEAEVFECMYHCGFEGSYAAAEAHELVCKKAPKEPEPAAVDVDESLFDDSDSD